MWNIVWVSPQGYRSVSVSRHFLLQAPQSAVSLFRAKMVQQRPLLPMIFLYALLQKSSKHFQSNKQIHYRRSNLGTLTGTRVRDPNLIPGHTGPGYPSINIPSLITTQHYCVCITLLQHFRTALFVAMPYLLLYVFLLSSIGWHMLPSYASAAACLTGWPNAQPQGWDQCSVVQHHQASLMVCVV